MELDKIMNVAEGEAPADDMVYHEELKSRIIIIARTKEGKRKPSTPCRKF